MTSEVGRIRHHAELTAMMTLQYRNAAQIAEAICRQSDGPSGSKNDVMPTGTPTGQMHQLLLVEQKKLIQESLERFGHAKRRASLPVGTVEEALA